MALVRGCGRRKLRGAGFMDFINSVGNFAKKSLMSVKNALYGTGGSGRRRMYRGGRRRLQGGSFMGTFLAGLLGHGRRHRLHGGSAHPRTAQLLDINPPRTRIARLRKAF
jgi:hypothetical protein